MTIWLISDTHFYHANILTFTTHEGGPRIRPDFASVEEMNETMIERWNRVVRPGDHIYHLGDVSMRCSSTLMGETVRRLNGKKRLVRGNHDKHKASQYIKAGFEEIHGMHLLAGMWLTHCPIHLSSMGRSLGNVHGHIHEKRSPAGPYVNVSVEMVDYTPISVEEAQSRLRVARESYLGSGPPQEDGRIALLRSASDAHG
jgi:calcineurin-like phosphoesterase family protein